MECACCSASKSRPLPVAIHDLRRRRTQRSGSSARKRLPPAPGEVPGSIGRSVAALPISNRPSPVPETRCCGIHPTFGSYEAPRRDRRQRTWRASGATGGITGRPHAVSIPVPDAPTDPGEDDVARHGPSPRPRIVLDGRDGRQEVPAPRSPGREAEPHSWPALRAAPIVTAAADWARLLGPLRLANWPGKLPGMSLVRGGQANRLRQGRGLGPSCFRLASKVPQQYFGNRVSRGAAG